MTQCSRRCSRWSRSVSRPATSGGRGATPNYFNFVDVVPNPDGTGGTVTVCEFDGAGRYNAATGSIVDSGMSSGVVVYTGAEQSTSC
jgi:hypothetical protein